jgi:urease accessory protein
MMITRRTISLMAAVAVLTASSAPAFAHHVMGGAMPSNFAQGFLSGIGHPIIGMDHFLFIIGVGLLAGIMERKILLPAAFILGTLGGGVLHLMGLNIPFAEAAIVASVVLMAVAFIANWRGPVALTAAMVAAAGIFHGYAYAETIFGAEPTPLYAYFFGFALVQFVIAYAAASILELLQRRGSTLANASTRVAGGALAGVALVAISNMAFGL